MSSVLEVKDMDVAYGVIHALRAMNIEVNEGEIVTLVGANGAGKSTFLKAVCGLVPSKGTIFFKERDITSFPTHRRIAIGMVMVPEGRGIFANMTVKENLLLGGFRNIRD